MTSNTSLPFQEAIDFYRAKGRITTQRWTDVYARHHSSAFMVAGAARDALLSDFQTSIGKAIEQGTTLQAFRKDFDKIVKKHGWSYKGARGWRSRVIFETNVRQAYNAGAYQRRQEIKADKPYLRYVAVSDGRTRPQHLAWHNTILPADHVFWDTHTPMNGWNCRCSVQALSAEEVRGFGKRVGKLKTPPNLKKINKQIDVGGRKVTVRVPEGIDPGFEYNPGEAGFGRTSPEGKALAAHGSFTPIPLPQGNVVTLARGRPEANPARGQASILEPLSEVSVRVSLATRIAGVVTAKKLQSRMRHIMDGKNEKIFTDPAGGKVKLTTALADHIASKKSRMAGSRERFFPLIPELIEDPSEIWISFARASNGKVLMRKRYVKLIRIDKKRVLTLVADQDNGIWSAFTFFPARSGWAKIREGLRTYRKE